MALHFGIDCLLRNPPSWKNQRIGLVTNHAATTAHLSASREALLENGFKVVVLFSPEHGLDVQGADGHEMLDGKDVLTGLPVISLYSHKLAPSPADLLNVDILLFDIPDVGSRFYTYLWTLTHVMEAAAAAKKKLVVLDRPNPVSGNLDLAEGPILDESQASFIGRWPVPVRHSCTLGELALYFNAERHLACDLELVRCEGWERNSFQPDWGIRFVPTSPAIRDFNSMLLYPGTCLLEATNISEGRGTDTAFQLAGAPWMDGMDIAGIFHGFGMDEVEVESVAFTPDSSKYQGELCQGIRLTPRDPAYFQPVFLGLVLIRMVKELYPSRFAWAPYPTLVNPTGEHHLDKLLGIPDSEDLFSLPLPKFMAEVTKLTRCADWKKAVSKYLLY